MPELAFVMSPNQNWFYRELVETLQYELAEQGMPSLLNTDGFPEPTPERVYALVAPNEFVALETEDALPDETILARTIFISAAHPSSDRLENDIELSRRVGRVFTINPRSAVEFARAGIAAQPLRPGYSVVLDHFDADANRDIDVLFLAGVSRRRTKLLARCARALQPFNTYLLFSDNSEPNPAASSTFVTGAKWDLLTRAKVLLNIHQDEDPSFEWPRALDAIHAGAVIVSEQSSGLAPLLAGEHLFAADEESLPFVLDYALSESDRLACMRTAAYDRIRSWLPAALPVATLRAAAVELVGRPVPPNAPLGCRFTSETRPSYRWFPTRPDETDPELEALRRGLRDVGAELSEMRKQIAELEQLACTETGHDGKPDVLFESHGWAKRTDPKVSVVMVIRDHAAFIGDTLDSIATNHMHDFEVIVVDDRSSDCSRTTTIDWMSNHPWVPALLLGHKTNRGTGAARNAALDEARAPYCCVIDAENEIYPRCLDALASTLDDLDHITFAYPMVEVCGITDPFAGEDPGHMQNVFGWQPERLRLGNYINTPAMIRIDSLRELGGFSTDPRLRSREDHKLWCQIAEHGWYGQLVPRILARRRVTLSSILATPSLFDAEAFATVIESAPKLMLGVRPQV